MALIIDNRFCFIHIPKTAGMTVRTLLAEFFDTYEYEKTHCAVSDVDKKLFFFTFVRNPFDLLISLYSYILKDTEHPLNEIYTGNNFSFFVNHYLTEMLNKGKTINGRHLTQTDYCYQDETNQMYFTGRHENFETDLRFIFRVINPDIQLENIPYINKSREVEKYKEYRKYYTTETIRLVEKYYKKDLINFNYKF